MFARILLAVGILLIIVAIAMFVKFNLPERIDEITGKKEERQIAKLRELSKSGTRFDTLTNTEGVVEPKLSTETESKADKVEGGTEAEGEAKEDKPEESTEAESKGDNSDIYGAVTGYIDDDGNPADPVMVEEAEGLMKSLRSHFSNEAGIHIVEEQGSIL